MIWQSSQRKQPVSSYIGNVQISTAEFVQNMNHISHIVNISHSTENFLPQNVKETLENAVF